MKIGDIMTNIAPKKFFSRIGFNYLILGIAAILLQAIIIAIIVPIYPQILGDMTLVSLISSICIYILPFPLFYYLMKKLETVKIEKTRISPIKFLEYICITLTLLWIGNITGLILTALIGGFMQSDIINPVQEVINNTHIMFNILVISIIGPIFEEIIFRKILIDRTIKYGARVSIILSAVIFALFHANLNQFFYALLMGGFFAYVYIKTGKIIYPILLHFFINIFGSVVSLMIGTTVMNLENGVMLGDLLIIILYLLILLAAFIVGGFKLVNYKKSKFNGEKTEIELENPLKTMFLNAGMIFFILFYIYQIISQLGIVPPII